MRFSFSIKLIIAVVLLATYACEGTKQKKKQAEHPNIIIVYVDDLGYGDVGCYGAVGVKTPNIDKLAAEGQRFTDGHCPASTCTPSRFSLLTGKYAFRNNAGILPGNAPALIQPGMPTIASMLKRAGYATAVVGKWHLGLGDGNINWNDSVKPGPREIGFDYSFLIPATGDRVPCVYLEDYHVVNLDKNDPITVSYKRKKIGNMPDGKNNKELLRVKADGQHSNTIVNGISRIGFMDGGEAALWVDEDFPEVLTGKAKDFINKNKSRPFFLYFAFQDIHVPRVANKQFEGVSKMGVRGDVIAQMDWCTGEIMKELEKLGIHENTFIIFSSDNGPVLNDGYEDQSVELLGEHKPAGSFRGGKYSAFEAGTRVPMITHWPARIKPGINNTVFTHVDLYASIAELVGQELEADEAADSYNMLPALLGESDKGREIMLEEAFTLALRKGQWKYIRPTQKKQAWIENNKKIESGLSNEPKLYNLENDPSETTNLAEKYPEIVKEMEESIQKIEKNEIRRTTKK